MEVIDSDCEEERTIQIPKKRPKHGRMKDATKLLRLQSHETGDPCKCKRRCFTKVDDANKQEIISNINKMKSHDEINIYLSGLISSTQVQRRRPRLPETEASFRGVSHFFRVRIKENESVSEIQVCKEAFMSLHGIFRGKLDYLLAKLKSGIEVPRDNRGLHTNRPHKLDQHTIDKVHEHINSFQGRTSHYSLKKTSKLYLSEELDVKKMYNKFKEMYPDNQVSYESYRTVFNRDFNIGFGYPRSDTCSYCDTFKARQTDLEIEIKQSCETEANQRLFDELRTLNINHEVHLRKQKVFYDRKREAKKEARKSICKEAISMDFSKNFQCPNIATNDVYYKRQLSIYIFNIHVLSDSSSYFYMYPETIAKKGSDDVSSFLHHFVTHILDSSVKELTVFCYSCGGQNKNTSVIRMCHHLVHTQKRLKEIKMVFPVRGHSYLECDKNIGLIKQKTRTEIPEDWYEVFRTSRAKPSPFSVIEVDQNMIRSWTSHFNQRYESSKLSFPTRPIRELKVTEDHPVLVSYRDSYNGHWLEAPVLPPPSKDKKGKSPRQKKRDNKRKPTPEEKKQEREDAAKSRELPCETHQGEKLQEGTFILPGLVYQGILPISKEKYSDLQDLKSFAAQKLKSFTQNLHVNS